MRPGHQQVTDWEAPAHRANDGVPYGQTGPGHGDPVRFFCVKGGGTWMMMDNTQILNKDCEYYCNIKA